MERKPIFVICTKEEYPFLQRHLHEIFNVLEEEILIPYRFFKMENIENEIKAIEQGILDTIPKNSNSWVLQDNHSVHFISLGTWLNLKRSYACRTMHLTDTVYALKNVDVENETLDETEKNNELRYAMECNKKIVWIDAKQYTQQKTR